MICKCQAILHKDKKEYPQIWTRKSILKFGIMSLLRYQGTTASWEFDITGILNLMPLPPWVPRDDYIDFTERIIVRFDDNCTQKLE